MALSGSVDFNQNRDQIITHALKLIGHIEAGEPAEPEELADGSVTLNAMVKGWQGRGYHLWSKKEGVLFLTKGQNTYTLGPNSTDHVTLESSLVKTSLSISAAALATTITVTSSTGILTAYNIGVYLDNGTIHWTTVNGAPVGNVVTLTVALPSAAAAGKKVFSYQSVLTRPLRVMNARRKDELAEQDIPIILFSRQEYFDTPNKTNQSLTTEVYYDPQLTDGIMYLWPTPPDINSTIRFTFAKSLQDFDTAANDPDFPQEWIEALQYNLAVRLCPQYGVPTEERIWLKQEAEDMLNIALAWDDEPESVYFQPDLSLGGWD